MKHSTATFVYKDKHFTPVKRLPDSQLELIKISRHQWSDKELNLTTYNETYKYDDFYAACGEKWFDVFRCEENGKVYIPCANELFEYVEDPASRYKEEEQKRFDSIQKEEIYKNLTQAKALMQKAFVDLQEQNKNGKQYDYCSNSSLSEVTDQCLITAEKIDKIVYQK